MSKCLLRLTPWVVVVVGACLAGPAQADYSDVVDFFHDLYSTPADAAIFPVENQSLASIESAFGPRWQTSVQKNDFHRGIDIDGNLNADKVYAALPGYFYDYRQTTSGGHIVIIEHHLDDFLGGSVTQLTYGGKPFTRFYTWYMHLYDDGVANNGTSTDDVVKAWKQQLDDFDIKTPIAKGTQIGVLGNSGEPAPNVVYGPHLHFEVRIATNSSLEYQLNNNVTQWGFDPHMNPMFLFEPYAYGSQGEQGYDQVLSYAGQTELGLQVNYTSTNDDMPLLNRWEVTVTDDATQQVVATHILDINQRTGFDASETQTLDNWDETTPFMAPLPFGDQATQFDSRLVVPLEWIQPYIGGGYTINVTAIDIWGNSENLSFAAIPEPGALSVAMLGMTALAVMGQGAVIRGQWPVASEQRPLPPVPCPLPPVP